jgi:hypothetical protein
MKDFLLLFRGGDASRIDQQKSPELWQQHMMKWKTWMDGIAKDGRLLGGDPLAQGGTVLKGTLKQVIDGPYTEGKEIVGGYLKIKAEHQQGAIEIAKGCPIFEHDGIVEVREVQAM